MTDARRAEVDVLVPTYRRPTALALTLAGLASQTTPPARVIVSDQSPDGEGLRGPEIEAVVRILEARGVSVQRRTHLPRRGLAEHRQALLDLVAAPYALFLDDDVLIEPDLLERLLRAIGGAGCGFVGSAVIGLSHRHDVRPEEQVIAFWEGAPVPEVIRPGGPGWERHRLHNAANLLHLRERMPSGGDRLYKVAWVGGCVLYDAESLRAAGGFTFWRQLPREHSGEDVLAQLRVMERDGGAGLFPSGAYHLELPTTVPDRRVDAPFALHGSEPPARREGLATRP